MCLCAVPPLTTRSRRALHSQVAPLMTVTRHTSRRLQRGGAAEQDGPGGAERGTSMATRGLSMRISFEVFDSNLSCVAAQLRRAPRELVVCHRVSRDLTLAVAKVCWRTVDIEADDQLSLTQFSLWIDC